MLKKMTVAVCASAIAVLVSFNAHAYTVSYGSVNADALNVRPQPTTECTSLGLLPQNHQVTIVGEEGNWYVIIYGNSYAYVSKDYIIVTDNNVEYQFPYSTEDDPQTASQSSGNSRNLYIDPDEIPSYKDSQIPGEILVETAKQFLGTPYVYGGMSPEGFDCSGFVKYCYSLMNEDINRVACDQALNGVEVPPDEMLPGDILCFASSVGSTYIGHTAIYVGNGYFIHSPHSGYSVEYLPLDRTSYRERILNVRRILASPTDEI